jgi:hypothetical protein
MKPYFNENGITIYHADCREVLPSLHGVDVTFTDPPYGVQLGVKVNNQRFNRLQYLQTVDSPEITIPMVNQALELCFNLSSRLVMTPGVKNMFAYPKPSHVGSFYYPSASGCNSWGFSCWQPIFYYGKDPYGGSEARIELLPLGHALCAELRSHKASGGSFGNFFPKLLTQEPSAGRGDSKAA